VQSMIKRFRDEFERRVKSRTGAKTEETAAA
jgi:hypothetical protein